MYRFLGSTLLLCILLINKMLSSPSKYKYFLTFFPFFTFLLRFQNELPKSNKAFRGRQMAQSCLLLYYSIFFFSFFIFHFSFTFSNKENVLDSLPPSPVPLAFTDSSLPIFPCFLPNYFLSNHVNTFSAMRKYTIKSSNEIKTKFRYQN